MSTTSKKRPRKLKKLKATFGVRASEFDSLRGPIHERVCDRGGCLLLMSGFSLLAISYDQKQWRAKGPYGRGKVLRSSWDVQKIRAECEKCSLLLFKGVKTVNYVTEAANFVDFFP